MLNVLNSKQSLFLANALNNRDKQKLITIIAGSLLLYFASTGISYAAFRFLAPAPLKQAPISSKPTDGKSKIDLSAPKIAECPLNGAMFTQAERQIWGNRRPLTVMIENHAEARPQSGLSRADVVYEAVAEGGVTRLLVIFYCGASAEEMIIGPVRSARTYFMDFASEYGDFPLYAHVGGANKPGPANALGQIEDYKWLAKGNDLNQFSLGFPTFWRDYERIGHPVATEHTMYSTTDKLWEVAHTRNLNATDDKGNKWDKNFLKWKFKNDEESSKRGQTGDINFDFWSGYKEYSVNWKYDKESNRYLRFNNGQPHQDLDNDEQLWAKTVAVQFMKEKGPIDELKHLLYVTIGTGRAIIFRDGQAIQATWSKAKREARTKFTDSNGKEVEFNRGPIWIEIVPALQNVRY